LLAKGGPQRWANPRATPFQHFCNSSGHFQGELSAFHICANVATKAPFNPGFPSHHRNPLPAQLAGASFLSTPAWAQVQHRYPPQHNSEEQQYHHFILSIPLLFLVFFSHLTRWPSPLTSRSCDCRSASEMTLNLRLSFFILLKLAITLMGTASGQGDASGAGGLLSSQAGRRLSS
jgi:hypothetical protein